MSLVSNTTGSSTIRPVMVGTAGHVDHGKTSLVKNLTGVDTDKLEEEKRRGLSIDIAVAPCQLTDGKIVGIIDVPGHEDFIRNMVAGASAIDVLMLVVAADDAVMPQTIEHLKILKLLGVSRLMVVVTKTDLVDQSLIPLVQEELEIFVESFGFKNVPIVFASNLNLSGLEEVRSKLSQLVNGLARETDNRSFRMDVRAAFAVKGYGTVVTGIPSSGSIGVGENLELLPPMRETAVRGIQTYGKEASSTSAHISSALNLRDIEAAEIHRGMTLAIPGVYHTTKLALVTISNESQVVLDKRSKLKFHVGTNVSIASFRLIDCDDLKPGQEAFAQLKFQTPVVIAAGDRFIVRTLTPAITLGGGRVLSVTIDRLKRTTDRFLDRLLQAKEFVIGVDLLCAELAASSTSLFTENELIRLSQLPRDLALIQIEKLKGSGFLHELGSGEYLVQSRLEEVAQSLKKMVSKYHLLNKFAWGMKPAYACELLKISASSFPVLLKVISSVESELSLKHGRLALRSFNPQINPRQIKLREDILSRLHQAGIQTIARGNLKDELGMNDTELKLMIKLLVEEEEAVVVGNNLILASIWRDCREKLLSLFKQQSIVELGAFREATGASRNVATLLLDAFDSEGLTRRVEEGRVLNPVRSKKLK